MWRRRLPGLEHSRHPQAPASRTVLSPVRLIDPRYGQMLRVAGVKTISLPPDVPGLELGQVLVGERSPHKRLTCSLGRCGIVVVGSGVVSAVTGVGDHTLFVASIATWDISLKPAVLVRLTWWGQKRSGTLFRCRHRHTVANDCGCLPLLHLLTSVGSDVDPTL